MAGTLICRSCGTENDDSSDFCSNCGEYLRWELTRAMPAAIQFEGSTPTPMPIPAVAPDEPATAVEEPEPESDGDGGFWDEDEPTTATMPRVEIPAMAAVASEPITEPAINAGVLGGLVADAPAPVPAGPSVPVTGGATLVVRSVGADVLEQGDAAIGAVEAGGRITFEFQLRNVSRVVDNYDLIIAGLPDEWSTTTPETAYLVPYGSGGTSDQTVRVALHPPRTSESEARLWPFELIALSRASGGIAARVTAGIEVEPFTAWEVESEPALRSGRFRGHYAVTLSNRGNAPIELWLYAIDPNNKLRGRFANRMLALSPAESRTTRLEVRVPRPRPIGRAVAHRVSIDALPDEPDPEEPRESLVKRLKKFVTPGQVSVSQHGVKITKPKVKMPRPPQRQLKLEDLKRLSGGAPVGPLQPSQVTFRQKPVIPTWLIVLAAIIAALVALFLLTRNHQVEVPELVGMRSTFAAQQKIQQRGLRLNPTLRRDVTSLVRPGTVVAQYPAAGKKVDKGTQVTLEVAVGTGKVTVPNLAGKTRAQADSELRRHNLSLGDAEPVTAPLSWVVASQIPVPGLSVNTGTPIQVFLHKKPLTKAQKTAAAAAAAAAAKKAGSGSGSGGAAQAAIKVPPISGDSLDKYAQTVGQLGLIPQIERLVNPAAAGTLYQVQPAPGTKVKKGSIVTLVVSLGIPDIAFDNSKQIKVLDPLTGAKLGTAKGPDPIAIEPSFSPDGTEFVYRSATRVFLAKTAKPNSAQAIYQGTDMYTNVTFAPDPKANNVLALDRQLEGVGELCLARIVFEQLRTSCLPDNGWTLGRDIAWSPDGKEILAFGSRPNDPSTFGLIRFRTRKPFSTHAADWTDGSIATDVSEPGKGVIAAAFSPNGNQVALVSNLTSSGFAVTIVKPGQLDPTKGHHLPVAACSVAWRPDGNVLSVVQTNPTCSQPTGEIVQIAPGNPRHELVVTGGAADVTYQGVGATGGR